MEFLLAATISCSDGKWILDGIADTGIVAAERSEIIIEVIQAMPDDCQPWQYRGEKDNR